MDVVFSTYASGFSTDWNITKALDTIWTTAKDTGFLRLGNLLPEELKLELAAVGRPASTVLSLTVTLMRRLESEGDLADSSNLCTSVRSDVIENAGDTGRDFSVGSSSFSIAKTDTNRRGAK